MEQGCPSFTGGYYSTGGFTNSSYLSLAPPPPSLTSLQVLGDLSLNGEAVMPDFGRGYGNLMGGGVSGNGGFPLWPPGVGGEEGSEEDEDGKRTDPFSPEATIPLPFQLGDEYGYYGPTAIWKRNERERHRVRCVNEGYEKLRTILPEQDREKRLSKVETLRLAIRYMKHLDALLVDENHYNDCDCNLYVFSTKDSDSSSEEEKAGKKPRISPPPSKKHHKS